MALCVLWGLGCAPPLEGLRGPVDAAQGGAPASAGPATSSCPAEAAAPLWLPGSTAQEATLEYWLKRLDASSLDEPLLNPDQIARYNQTVGRRRGHHVHSQRDLLTPPDLPRLAKDVQGRLVYMHSKLKAGELVTPEGRTVSGPGLAQFEGGLDGTRVKTSLHVALRAIALRCGPHPAPLYKGTADPAYDRNACSTVRGQEAVQKLMTWDNGMHLVRTRYALGWVEANAPLSAPVTDTAMREAVVRGPRLRVDRTLDLGNGLSLPKHTSSAAPDGKLLLATANGFVRVDAPPGATSDQRPLTRRALLTTAFSFLDSPYGLGGSAEGRDCSRTLLDTFESFGIALPRHSGWQARAGTYQLELGGLSDADKRKRIEAAAADGVVLLHLPGHIMLYLGTNDAGKAMALHALGEYAQACPGGGETVFRVRRTVVTDLEVGRGSKRRAFIERIQRLVVVGKPPSPGLAEHAILPVLPPNALPDECHDSKDRRIFVSPRRPVMGERLRIVSVNEQDTGKLRLWLFGPDSELIDLPVKKLGGPPHSQWMYMDTARAGRYTAVLADGDEVVACDRFGVAGRRQKPTREPVSGIWESRWSWEHDTHNLWAAFVEQLFDYPAEDGRTWTNLHDLLRDRDRNLLYGHLGYDEDNSLRLEPDCADLPYTLRAYFAWKLRLPFGYRRCARGRVGQPPSCGELHTNQQERQANDDVAAFHMFANRQLRSGVHSASGRTHPRDNQTDLYPVALNRRSLPPGTVYADPYGHVMLLTKWFEAGDPEGGDYGILMASEAQPDGTVGRRRFWRGSFLFDPSTQDVGAGFKQFRPLHFDKAQGTMVALSNEELSNSTEHAPFSEQQYQGSRDDFYDRMDALINPQPLDARQRMTSLVDALEESVKRRVIAVHNGEQFMRERGYRSIEMPVGHEIFETSGPWEDFSTPSRDMRLLISMDTVRQFPDKVAQFPERYSLTAGPTLPQELASLRAELAAQLAGRGITYVRSDGRPQQLSLAQLVERAERLEVAYNPNDCVEVRWGAEPDSPESNTCKRRSAASQTQRMLRYRSWFARRVRPARGARQP